MTLTVRSVVAATREPGQPITPVLADAAPGWTPILAAESDGTRTVIKVDDWIGGTGAKPGTGYIPPTGSGSLSPDPTGGFNFREAL